MTASFALAQDEGQNRGGVADLLDEVVVTATKKQDAENVQDVALSVSAFNANTIDALNIQDLQDLTFSAPNASFDGVGSFRGFANFSIRGLGVTSSIPSIDPSVGVFVDGIFLGTNAGVLFDTFDLDSIEVLRGPQGLLFGRNTTGGAVVLNTANPTDEFSLKARASVEFPVGNGFGDPAETIQLVTSGPLVKDKLNGKLGVYFENDDGFFINQFTGEEQDAAETLLLRGALEFFPTDTITLLAKLEYMDSDGDGPGITNPGFFERGGFGIATDNPGFQETEAVTFSLRTDIDVAFGNGTITNIFGYRDLEQLANSDIDATVEQVFDVGIFTDQTQISNELRYAGTFGDIEVTTGGFIFQQDLGYDENRTLFGGAVLQAGGGFQDHLVLGGFANFDYNLNEKFVISAGLRYSYEEKDAEISIIGGGGVLADGSFCSVTQGTCATDFEETPDFDGFTPRFAVQYFPTDNQQLYANYSRGFRSGVFNFRSTSAAPLLFQQDTTGTIATDQESLDSFEIGYKFQTTDNRGKFNVAGFYTAIDDLIRDVTVADPISGVLQFTANAGDAELYGVEVETSYAVLDNLLLKGTFGYLGNNYTDIPNDLTGDGIVNEDDFNLELTRAPEFNGSVGLVHDLDLGKIGGLTTTLSYAYRSRQALTDNNLGFDQEQNRINADLTWRTPYEGVTLSIYGKNLTNEQSVGTDTQLPGVFGVGPFADGENSPFTAPAAGAFGALKQGRVLGIELTYEY